MTGLNLKAGTGNITLSETGGIADTDAGTDITANIAVVTISGATVQSVGSSTNPIVTSVNDLTLNTATGGGSQFVTNSKGLTGLNMNAGAGNVSVVVAAGGVSDSATHITANSA